MISNIKPTVPINRLWTIENPNIAERVILDLAGVIHRQSGSASSAISWKAQQLAAEYFDTHGLNAALTRIAEDE